MTHDKLISEAMRLLGSRTSEAKAAAARANGKRGGWHEHKARKAAVKSLGRTQQTVLHLLASGPMSISDLTRNWPGLTESGVRSAVDRLGMRSLVDVTDRPNGERGRVYRLTASGAAAELALLPSDEG